ncbi:hypothetical protein GT354_33435 [Streptomyces sp. SID3343]|nr:hypothetical protein [Streptomyces sp. SID3343]
MSTAAPTPAAAGRDEGAARSPGRLPRRPLLLGAAGALVLVCAAARWDPFNLAIFQEGVLTMVVFPWALAAALVSIEIAQSFRPLVVWVGMWIVGVLFTAVALLGLVGWFLFGGFRPADQGVLAVSPDGRVRAVQVDAHEMIDPKYHLALRTSRGLDRRMTVYFGCVEEHPPHDVRFVGNRTLEFTAPDGRVLRVRFDKNLNPDTVYRMC